MAEKNEYDYLMEGLSVDEQMTVQKDNKGILTGPYGVVIDPKQKASFKRNKSIANNLGISLSSNSSVEDFKRVATEIAKQNAQILQKQIPEYAQLKPEYKYILLDSKHHTGVTYKNLAKDLLAHQNNPSPATLAAVVKDSRRVDKINGAARTSAGFDNRAAKVLFRANLIDDIDTAKQLGLTKASDKAGLNIIDKFGVEARDVLPIEVAEQTQKGFEPVERESAFPVKEGEKVQYLDQPEPIEDVGTLDTQVQDMLPELPEVSEDTGISMVDVPMTSRQRKDLADRLAKDLGVERKSGLFGMGMTIPGTKIGFSEGGLSGFMTQEPSGTVEEPTRKKLSDVLKKLDESKGDIAKGAAEFIPGVGEAMAVKRVSDAMDEKDYTGAAIETAAGALGLIPVVGDAAGKALRTTTTKTLRKDANLTKQTDEVFSPPLEIGVNEYNVKNLDNPQLIKNYTLDDYNEVMMASNAGSTAGSKAKNKKINVPVSDGTEVAVRLNLSSKIDPSGPEAPFNRMQTIHPVRPKSKKPDYSKSTSYMNSVTVENGVFDVDQKLRRNIAETGQKVPAAGVQGKITSTRNVLEEGGDDIVEISMNPKQQHLFTDVSTGQAVKSFDVATVLRDRVYAKGVTYWKKSEAPEPLPSTNNTPINNEVRYKFKQGGAVPMKEQMELFEDGGLMDEGNTIDPVSGNDVPPGSTQEEVRDDIPAQLSEGEFVFPADVVRYIGLEKLMQMRQQAKMGLQTMDDMGQMGNSEEAIMPDNLPFELTDLDMDDEEEYNNDTVEMAVGGLLGPATGISGYTPSQFQPPEMLQVPTVQTQTMPISYTPPTQQQVETITPETYKDISYPGVVQSPEQAPQTLEIANPTTGERRTITFIPGVTQIPEGFVMASEYTAPKTSTVTPTVGQTAVSTRAQDKKDELESERIRADARAADARKAIIAEMFGEDYLNPNNIAKPFSDLLGKQKPGTVTTGGYIVGDNQEFLNPETGEEYMFGRLGSLREAGFLDKPPLEIKPGGINEKFRDAYLKKYAKDRSFKEVRSGVTAGDVALSKLRSENKEKDKQQKIFKDAKTFKDNKDAKEKALANIKDKKQRVETEKAIDKAQAAMDKIMKDKEPREYNTGGLASKPKPKPKQMRSGGLASKN